MKPIQLLLIIIFNPVISNAGLFGPSNLWECILKELSEAKTQTAAVIGFKRCEIDFPNKSDRKIDKSSFFSPNTVNECISKYARKTSDEDIARLIIKTCIDLYKDEEELALPDNGYVVDHVNQEMVAPLKFVTKNDGNHYWIKIFDWTSNVVVKEIFIRSGYSYETSVPLGTYGIKYAAGKKWYGRQKLFGKDTVYSKAEQSFSFSMQNNQYSGYTIELIFQRGGNLRTRGISENEW
mgnify:CR=1 FL=1